MPECQLCQFSRQHQASRGSLCLSRSSRRERGSRSSSEFGLRYWPSVLRNVVFLHEPDAGIACICVDIQVHVFAAIPKRFWSERQGCAWTS